MTTESVNFVLSAQDKASTVFNKTKEELALLNDEVQQTTKGSQEGADAVGKLARALGGGWLVDAAGQAKEVSDSVKSMSAALGKGGSSAMVAKAGLVGLVAVGSFKVGQMIRDWATGAEAFRKEMERAFQQSLKISEELNKSVISTLDKKYAMLNEFNDLSADGDEAAQLKSKDELVAQLKKELKGKDDAILSGERQADEESDEALKRQLEANNKLNQQARDSLALTKEKLEAEAESLRARVDPTEYQQILASLRETVQLDKDAKEEAEERLKQKEQETDAANKLTETLHLQIAQMQMSANEYELMVAMQTTSDTIEQHKLTVLIKQKQEIEAQKTATEELAKQQEEAFKAFAKAHAEQVKAGQDAKKKQLDDQVKQSEKDIEKLKNDSSGQSFTSLSGSDTRMLSRSQNKIDYEARTFELQKKQQELAVKMEAHLKLVAKQKPKQAKILQLIAGGGF